ncbi:MAG: hypothetical protein ACW99G_15285 [Candidatus Thorarchaeota archaeon]|jgi:hypothetical protein
MKEYWIFTSDTPPVPAQFETAANDGWELVSVLQAPGAFKKHVYVSYFVREKDITNITWNTVAAFFLQLTKEEQLILLECATGALRDELHDGFLRENEILDLDLSDEALVSILEKLKKFMEGA